MGRFHTQIQTRLLSHPLPKISRPLYFSILLLFSSSVGLAQFTYRYFYVSAYYCFLLLLNISVSYYFLFLLAISLFLLFLVVIVIKVFFIIVYCF